MPGKKPQTNQKSSIDNIKKKNTKNTKNTKNNVSINVLSNVLSKDIKNNLKNKKHQKKRRGEKKNIFFFSYLDQINVHPTYHLYFPKVDEH